MTADIETFVALKYQIITDDQNTWFLCETYPLPVVSTWAWKCAASVEHLAKGYIEAEKCIEVAKKYRDGLATREELYLAEHAAYQAGRLGLMATRAPYRAGSAAAYAAFCVDRHDCMPDCIPAAARSAANAYAHYISVTDKSATYADIHFSTYATRWKLYTSWLIEELCNWEKCYDSDTATNIGYC